VEGRAKFEVTAWNRIYDGLLSQAEKIRQSGFRPDVIVGITRGGWIPARVLSDLLEIPDLVTVRLEFYLGVAETKNEAVLTQGVSVVVKGKKALIVDDVSDTGKSLQLAREYFRQQGATEVRIANVYRKLWSAITPDYYGTEISCCVVFAWETKEPIRKIVEKHGDKNAMDVETAKLEKAGLPKQLERFLKEVFEERDC